MVLSLFRLARSSAGSILIFSNPTERKHVVLRPQHLSPALVPNSLLKRITSGVNSEEGLNFAHADAVVEMALDKCINQCPVSVILDCIRAVLDPFEEKEEQDSPLNEMVTDVDDSMRGNRKQSKGGRLQKNF